MIRVGWLADPCSYIGGAELSAAEFRAAAPDGVAIVDCPPGNVSSACDHWVIHNCVLYSPDDLGCITGPAFKMWHDVGPHISREQHKALERALPVCVSPLQATRMKLDEAALIPPAVPLQRFRKAAENATERQGAVAVGPWVSPFKAPDAAAEWAAGNGGIDFYGEGPFAPAGSRHVPYEELPEILARYKTYVHLPREIEPFGRSTVEAWAAGCEVVVNRLVGARWWIAEQPEKLDSAAADFWRLILQ